MTTQCQEAVGESDCLWQIKIVKKLLAIIFSLALASAHLLAFAGDAPLTGQKVKSCTCKASCCAAKSNDTSKESPAVPAPGSSLKSFQFAFTPTACSLSPQIFPDEPLISRQVAPILSQSVPLFTRDCSYLL